MPVDNFILFFPIPQSQMRFWEARIKKDIENLTIPVKYKLEDKTLYFSVDINTDIYNGTYKFRIEFTEEYPFTSPKLFCDSKVFHPNIDSEGRVCLKVLREGWMPCFDINSIIVSLICSFNYLSGEDALNTEAGDLFEQDYELFKCRARSYKQ